MDTAALRTLGSVAVSRSASVLPTRPITELPDPPWSMSSLKAVQMMALGMMALPARHQDRLRDERLLFKTGKADMSAEMDEEEGSHQATQSRNGKSPSNEHHVSMSPLRRGGT
jgi:hypothetical protein